MIDVARSNMDYMNAENQIAKYNQSLLEVVDKRTKELKALATDKLLLLEEKAINDLKENDVISRETEKMFLGIDDIIGTVADEKSNQDLVEARNKVLLAFHPRLPYNFPNDFFIQDRLIQYRMKFDQAVAGHYRKWENFLMEQSSKALKRRDEDILELLHKLGKGSKALQQIG